MAITTTTLPNVRHDWAALLARILLAGIFILSGWSKIAGFEGTAGYIASKGLPMSQVLAALAIVVELGGGLLLLVGWKARWAALAIAVFTLLAAFLFHNYWAASADQRMGVKQRHRAPATRRRCRGPRRRRDRPPAPPRWRGSRSCCPA